MKIFYLIPRNVTFMLFIVFIKEFLDNKTIFLIIKVIMILHEVVNVYYDIKSISSTFSRKIETYVNVKSFPDICSVINTIAETIILFLVFQPFTLVINALIDSEFCYKSKV